MYLFLLFALLVSCSCECLIGSMSIETTLEADEFKELDVDVDCATLTSLNKTTFRVEFYWLDGQMTAPPCIGTVCTIKYEKHTSKLIIQNLVLTNNTINISFGRDDPTKTILLTVFLILSILPVCVASSLLYIRFGPGEENEACRVMFRENYNKFCSLFPCQKEEVLFAELNDVE